MNSKTVANFDGLTFLDKLETIFNMKGLEGIIELVEEHFPIGCFMKMNQNKMCIRDRPDLWRHR